MNVHLLSTEGILGPKEYIEGVVWLSSWIISCNYLLILDDILTSIRQSRF